MNEPTPNTETKTTKKVILEAYNEKAVKYRLDQNANSQSTWSNYVGTAPMPDKFFRWKGQEITIVQGLDGGILEIQVPALPASSGNPTSSPRSSSGGWRPGRSEEETRRIARQACLNTATNIYSEALKVNAGTFHSSESVATPQIAAALKFEIIRIAEQLEEWVFR